MVEFTYQDYLKYEKMLQMEEQKKKENKFIHMRDEDVEVIANQLLRIEEMLYETDSQENAESMLMEENEAYDIRDITTKKQLEESRKKHDELFRSLLNNKEEFISFIKYFVNPETKLTKNNLEKYNRSFITTRYESRNSDIVYKEKNSETYYLIEHQSSIDYDMPYRMLEYSYEIIRDTIDKEKVKSKNYEFPKVIPIVLYTGNQKWKIPNVIGVISDGKYEDAGLRLKYILIDTNEYSKKELLSSNSMVGYAMQADRSSTSEEVANAIEKMLVSKPKMHKEIYKMILYVFKGRLEETEQESLKQQIKEGKVEEVMITVRERLAQNDETILQKGIAKGIAQEKNKRIIIAKKLLNIGMKEEDVLKITGLSMNEIK